MTYLRELSNTELVTSRINKHVKSDFTEEYIVITLRNARGSVDIAIKMLEFELYLRAFIDLIKFMTIWMFSLSTVICILYYKLY